MTLGQRVLVPPPPPPEVHDPSINHGAVFTRRWVVDFILDLVGYEATEDLSEKQLVEPACGDGAFLLPIADRVIQSCREYGRPLTDAKDAVRAFDLQLQHVQTSRELLVSMFTDAGLDEAQAHAMAELWVQHRDFLLTPHGESWADFVVGNPPYIRPEDVPTERMALYKDTWPTMIGRADIYVGFFEAGLRLLADGGVLGFICADRWMRNAYGKKLRDLVARGFSVDIAIEMHDADAFANEVSAYPAITVLRRGEQGDPLVATATGSFDADATEEVVHWAREHPYAGAAGTVATDTRIARLPGWFEADSLWPTGSPERLALLRELEDRLPLLEVASTRVGIGVATGADAVFITTEPNSVEPDRLVPLAMTRDTTSGTLKWGGTYLINPWAAPQRLVELRDYPKLADHFERNAVALKRRYVAGKRPSQWYCTIDPIHEDLTGKRKLLFPDMKMFSHPVLDEGGHYPHHNLYYVISDEWDLETLGGILMSRVAQFFIESYAVRMRGGTLRFQAQYLRRIRVPEPSFLDEVAVVGLRTAFRKRDVTEATRISLEVYGLDHLPD